MGHISNSLNLYSISMFNRVVLKPCFDLVQPFVDLFVQLGITFTLIHVLLLKDCLDIFLWTCQMLKMMVNRMLQILCVKNSLVWASFLKGTQKNFSEPFFQKLSYKEKQSIEELESAARTLEDSESLTRTPKCQTQRNDLLAECKSSEQYLCQRCRIMSEVLLRRKNLNKTSCSPIYELIKNSVGTQTLIQRDNEAIEHLHVQTPPRDSTTLIFGRSKAGSAESLKSCLKPSSIKQISLDYNVSSPKYPSSSLECNDALSSRNLSLEFEKTESSQLNENDSRTTPEEFVDIPLESPVNVSQLLESPLCQINLESMRNLRLQFSQDMCIPRLSPEEKSIFRKNWEKLKLMRKVNKRLLQMKNMKRENHEVSTIFQQPVGVESTDVSNQNEIKDSNTDSEIIGCCSYVFRRLKSKFDQKSTDSSVVYKKF